MPRNHGSLSYLDREGKIHKEWIEYTSLSLDFVFD